MWDHSADGQRRRDQAGENDRSHLIEDHMSDDDGIYWQCQGMNR